MSRVLLCTLALLGVAGCGDNLDDPTTPIDPEPVAATCSDGELATLLATQPGVASATEENCGPYVDAPARCFQLTLTQPIDHAMPDGPSFAQRLFLVHRGCERPMVVADWGYSNDLFYDDELASLFHTNTLWIEHRYQGESVPAPDDWDWSALTIENGATDMHGVITTLKAIYGGRWVSTGASKGGITATYHSFFFKHDLDGSIPYVAPASRSRIDPDYQGYLGAHMTSPCAQALRDAQVAALTTRRAAMIAQLTPLVPAGYEPLFLEFLVEYTDWGFWQYYGKSYCSAVPTATSTDEAFFNFFRQVNGFPARTPATDERSNAALDYEWLSEQGFALQIGEHVRDLLTMPTATATMEDGFRAQYPDVDLPAYDGSVTRSVRHWVETRAQNMLFIYGELDPWSGGALEEPAHPTSARFFVPGATHSAQIGGLATAERTAALAHAERMFGEPPDLGNAHRAMAAGARRDEILSRTEGVMLWRLMRPR